jgi:hypothetical protein
LPEIFAKWSNIRSQVFPKYVLDMPFARYNSLTLQSRNQTWGTKTPLARGSNLIISDKGGLNLSAEQPNKIFS